MRFYISVMFWLGIVMFCIRIGCLGAWNWPRKKETSLGEFVGATILSLAFTIWAGILLFAL